MKFTTFAALYGEAIEASNINTYIEDRGWQDWMDLHADKTAAFVDTTQIVNILKGIYDLANNNLADTRKALNLSRPALSELTHIPARNIQNWETEERGIKPYIKLHISYILFSEFYEVNHE